MVTVCDRNKKEKSLLEMVMKAGEGLERGMKENYRFFINRKRIVSLQPPLLYFHTGEMNLLLFATIRLTGHVDIFHPCHGRGWKYFNASEY
jgi:hypothetical protein